MAAADLVGRLEGVRERGPNQWIARCPAHNDRSPSLSILELEDRVLVHCFAGCDAAAICGAIGLDLRALFRPDVQRRLRHHGAVLDEMRRRIPARDALTALAVETGIVAYTAADLIERRAIDNAAWERLVVAYRLISDAAAVWGSRR